MNRFSVEYHFGVGIILAAIQVPVPFFALLLDLSIFEDYILCASDSVESTIPLREMSLFKVLHEGLRRTLAMVLPAMNKSDIPQ